MQRTLLAARWIFAICCIGFVLAYPSNIQDHVVYVPKWLPPGSVFWVATGICFVLAGVAILTGILDVLAAWLLGLMFLTFNLTILPSFIFTDPHNHAAWGDKRLQFACGRICLDIGRGPYATPCRKSDEGMGDISRRGKKCACGDDRDHSRPRVYTGECCPVTIISSAMRRASGKVAADLRSISAGKSC